MLRKFALVSIILISLILTAMPSSGALWVGASEFQTNSRDVPQIPSNELEISVKKTTLTFNEPISWDVDEYLAIDMDGASRLADGGFGKPMLPYKTQVFKFKAGTEIVDVNFYPEIAAPMTLPKKIVPSQTPNPISQLATAPEDELSVEYGPLWLTRPDLEIYSSSELYPNTWVDYRTGLGLDPETDDLTLFLTVSINPVRYRPTLDIIEYLDSVELEIMYRLPNELDNVNGNRNADISDPKPLVDYDLLIITPAGFVNALQPLVDHKKNTSIIAKIVTLTDIDNSVYFPKTGVDQQEQIKYFIFNAKENWNITYVILVGDIDKMPFRKAIIIGEGDGDVPSDVYFADFYDSQMDFCDWDSDGDGIYGEYNANSNQDIDRADLYPDVYLGRLPASTTFDVEMFVDKIIYYELNAAADIWFENATLVGLDTFNEGSGVYEGEYAADYIGDNYLTDFVQTKLYQSMGTCNRNAIVSALNKGSGFATFHDHGNIDSWAGKFSGADALALTNGHKLPFLNFDACLTGAFDSNDCIAEDVVLNYNGGAITSIGASRIGYGMWGAAHISRYSGYFNIRLYKNYDDGISTAGKILDAAKLDYLRNIGTPNFADYKTVVEYNLFGDPTLSVGGLPIKFFNLTCEDNSSNVDPGETASYEVTLSNNGKLTRTIKLYVGDKPSGWTAVLNQSTITIDPDTNVTITLNVTVPSDELAYTIGDIDVFAYFSKNKDKTISVTTRTIVNRIYGVELDLKPDTSHTFKLDPGQNELVDIVVWNHGNDIDTIDFTTPTAPQDWVLNFVFGDEVIENIDIDPHKFKVVYLNITVPDQTLVGDYPIITLGALQNPFSHINDTLGITVAVSRVYGVEVYCEDREFTVEPGDMVEYDIQINHTGNDVDIIKVTLNKIPQNWTMEFSHEDNFLIDPYDSEVATLKLGVPDDELAGTYLTEALVELMGDGSRTKIVTITTIDRYFGFNVTCYVDTFTIEGGDTEQHTIYLRNEGNGEDSVDLRFIKKPQNWNIKLKRTEDIALSPFGDTSVGLSVVAPKHTLAGEYNISVEAALDGDGSTEYVNITAIVERTYEFKMNCPVTQATRDPGISAKFDVEFVNNGNAVDHVNLSILDLPDNWKTSLSNEGTTFTVDAFSSVKEIVTITSDVSGKADEYEMEIVGTLLGDDSTETIPISVRVIQLFDVELEIEEDEKATYPDQEVYFNITVRNSGNGDDEIRREVNGLPQNLENNIRFPLIHTYELAPGQERAETMRILIPAGYDPGYINFSVYIYSEGDPSHDEKVNMSTLVEQVAQGDEESSEFDIFDFSNPSGLVFLIVIALIIIILIVVAVVLSRRSRREMYREQAPPPLRHAPPPPPPPRGRRRGSGRRRGPRGAVRGRGGRRPRDKVRWRESQLDEEEPEVVEEDEEEIYDVDAEDDEDADWDEDEKEDRDEDEEWLEDDEEEGEEVYDMDAEDDEPDWEADDGEAEEVEELDEPEDTKNHKFLDVDWE